MLLGTNFNIVILRSHWETTEYNKRVIARTIVQNWEHPLYNVTYRSVVAPIPKVSHVL